MSKQGQINRGKKWYMLNRDVDGNLNEVVTSDPNKMVDVNAYLATVKESPSQPTPTEEKEETKSKRQK